jgi:hypothetical protein
MQMHGRLASAADVVIVRIMQSLRDDELLRFSRTCRRVLEVAEKDWVWKRRPPWTFSAVRPHRAPLGCTMMHSGRLRSLKRAPVKVILNIPEERVHEFDVESLCALHRMVSIDMRGTPIVLLHAILGHQRRLQLLAPLREIHISNWIIPQYRPLDSSSETPAEARRTFLDEPTLAHFAFIALSQITSLRIDCDSEPRFARFAAALLRSRQHPLVHLEISGCQAKYHRGRTQFGVWMDLLTHVKPAVKDHLQVLLFHERLYSGQRRGRSGLDGTAVVETLRDFQSITRLKLLPCTTPDAVLVDDVLLAGMVRLELHGTSDAELPSLDTVLATLKRHKRLQVTVWEQLGRIFDHQMESVYPGDEILDQLQMVDKDYERLRILRLPFG